jgi:hypothetical protein
MVARALLIVGGTILSSLTLTQSALPLEPTRGHHHTYLGRTPPGTTPEVFLEIPGVYVQDADISPGMNEIFFTQSNSTWDKFMLYSIRRNRNGSWTQPIQAPFLGSLSGAMRPYSSHDGRRLYFVSESPRDAWVTLKTPFGWSPAIKLPEPINTDAIENAIFESSDRTLWFCTHRVTDATKGGCDLFYSKLEHGGYLSAVALEALNTDANDCAPAVSPDGKYLLFHSNRPGGYGTADLYVSFNDGEGNWSEAVNLGPEVNTPAVEVIAHFSPDGKYILFTRRAAFQTDEPSKVYWVSTRILKGLKP